MLHQNVSDSQKFPIELTKFFQELLGEEVLITGVKGLLSIFSERRNTIIDALYFEELIKSENLSDISLFLQICKFVKVPKEDVNNILKEWDSSLSSFESKIIQDFLASLLGEDINLSNDLDLYQFIENNKIKISEKINDDQALYFHFSSSLFYSICFHLGISEYYEQVVVYLYREKCKRILSKPRETIYTYIGDNLDENFTEYGFPISIIEKINIKNFGFLYNGLGKKYCMDFFHNLKIETLTNFLEKLDANKYPVHFENIRLFSQNITPDKFALFLEYYGVETFFSIINYSQLNREIYIKSISGFINKMRTFDFTSSEYFTTQFRI